MKKPIGRYKAIGFVIIIGIVMNQSQVVQAGWSGGMNGFGFGWASANVTSSFGVYDQVDSAVMNLPSASMPFALNYSANKNLPFGSSFFTTARIKGTNGYIW